MAIYEPKVVLPPRKDPKAVKQHADIYIDGKFVKTGVRGLDPETAPGLFIEGIKDGQKCRVELTEVDAQRNVLPGVRKIEFVHPTAPAPAGDMTVSMVEIKVPA